MFPETKVIRVQSTRRGGGVWQIIDHQGEKYRAKDIALGVAFSRSLVIDKANPTLTCKSAI